MTDNELHSFHRMDHEHIQRIVRACNRALETAFQNAARAGTGVLIIEETGPITAAPDGARTELRFTATADPRVPLGDVYRFDSPEAANAALGDPQ